MKIIVTGAAGFIGSNLVKGLNQLGVTNIIAVDNLENGNKFLNLRSAQICDYLDKREFYQRFAEHAFGNVDVVFHQGACSSTVETNGRYVMQENYANSRDLLAACLQFNTRLIYASSAAVYGASEVFKVSPENELPLNVYGYSKWLFDHHVRGVLAQCTQQIVGLRYFNVYGPGEAHKGRMASVVWHHWQQIKKDGCVKLFGAYNGYADGEQERDFVSVSDIVSMNLFMLEKPHISGIFNAGTGRAEPFNHIAHAIVNQFLQKQQKPALNLKDMVQQGWVQYIDFPNDLIGRYQCHTCADLSQLREQGYDKNFATVAEGIAEYAKSWE